ncbi:MAG: hypothetical protein WA771_07525, partial [Chthoniobacterales bacterium]
LGCYGDLIYLTPSRVFRYWRAGSCSPGSFGWGWMPPHPTVFVRAEVFHACGGFRQDLGSAADYEWLLRTMVKHEIPLEYIPRIQVAMSVGGMSNASIRARLDANHSDRRAWELNSLQPHPWTFAFKPLRKLPQWVLAPLIPYPRDLAAD